MEILSCDEIHRKQRRSSSLFFINIINVLNGQSVTAGSGSNNQEEDAVGLDPKCHVNGSG